ncbi:shikimate dehydrogenase [Hydrogenivirga caldilitoris]|uniref:Shikimate dehydrogenase (NADP(+)) n=1 Tax=Hydrogenivirga caldilitoris TaxID=246264 RepID=A0A497XRX5_9AQUI|nr:shikimate dehydrogenase [Hydrogenivirga caldilitoris]RLJ71034.1 shikimate dehydrogenase [Hydrogenivirga caldilitoris]
MNLKGSSQIYGVIGYPVHHSLSPVFQNAAFEYLGLDAVYIPLEVHPDNLESFLKGLKGLENFVGLNVTVPHKEKVLKLADSLSEEVEKIGAANTLKFNKGRIEAYNTDWLGFLRAAELLSSLEDKRVLVLGAGGASRAILYALNRVGAQVFLWNRSKDKAVKLSREFDVSVVEDLEETLRDSDIVVNTTSVGLKEEDPPIFDYSLLKPEHIVIDIIYRETPLIKAAKEIGCLYQTGFPMLLYQGAESFKIWTGCEPPLKVMELSLKEYGYPTENSRTHQQT